MFVVKFQHRNLVWLLGYCSTLEEKLLVYEFVPRKSFELILFVMVRSISYVLKSRSFNSIVEMNQRYAEMPNLLNMICTNPDIQGQLNWTTCYKIMKGIAQGILDLKLCIVILKLVIYY